MLLKTTCRGCWTHHRRRHAGAALCITPGEHFMPDSPPATTRQGCPSCAAPGDPFTPALPFVCSPRQPLHAGHTIGDNVPGMGALGTLSAQGDNYHEDGNNVSGLPPTGAPDAISTHDDDVLGPSIVHGLRRTLRRRVCRQHHRAGTRQHASFDPTPSSAPPLLPTPSTAPRRGTAASRGLTRLSHRSMEAPWTGRDSLTRVVRLGAIQCATPSTYTISGAWATLRRIARSPSPLSCRSMEAPWAGRDSATWSVRRVGGGATLDESRRLVVTMEAARRSMRNDDSS
ncbi:hypothetical protein VPH35_119745 [Triticum aestivum]